MAKEYGLVDSELLWIGNENGPLVFTDVEAEDGIVTGKSLADAAAPIMSEMLGMPITVREYEEGPKQVQDQVDVKTTTAEAILNLEPNRHDTAINSGYQHHDDIIPDPIPYLNMINQISTESVDPGSQETEKFSGGGGGEFGGGGASGSWDQDSSPAVSDSCNDSSSFDSSSSCDCSSGGCE
jgi:hypothetical protein